jgi:hypothetical protein
MDRSIGRPAADLSLIDLTTGERTKIKERLRGRSLRAGKPSGRYLLYLQDDHYWTIDTPRAPSSTSRRACRLRL